MTFKDAVYYVLAYEGGYSIDPNDPGGETNHGISKRSFPELDIKRMTKEQAVEIYRLTYWDKMKCESLPPWLRLMAFDCAVNQGVTKASRLLQECLGTLPDGIIGPLTIAKASKADSKDVLLLFAAKRLSAYSKLQHWEYYGAGWSKRLLEVSMLSSFQA